jgi:hypothetical protein
MFPVWKCLLEMTYSPDSVRALCFPTDVSSPILRDPYSRFSTWDLTAGSDLEDLYFCLALAFSGAHLLSFSTFGGSHFLCL